MPNYSLTTIVVPFGKGTNYFSKIFIEICFYVIIFIFSYNIANGYPQLPVETTDKSVAKQLDPTLL